MKQLGIITWQYQHNPFEKVFDIGTTKGYKQCTEFYDELIANPKIYEVEYKEI
jgi:hypothetical protein